MSHRLAVVLALLGLLPGLALANDTALSVRGGLAGAMSEHPSIRMVTALITADLHNHYSLVQCEYLFRNEGPATTVSMGFPSLPGYGDVPDLEVAPELRDFRSWIDGKPVATRQVQQAKQEGEDARRRWYVKEVPFAPGQERKVRNSYRQPNGHVSTGEQFLPYVLSTGASWHGPIGSVEVRVRWAEGWYWEPHPDREEEVSWQSQPDPGEYRWTATNLDPRFDLRFEFLPGWQGGSVDGHPWPYLFPRPSMRVTATEVYFAARALAELLQATVTYDGRSHTATFALPRGRRYVVRAGTAPALLDGTPVREYQEAVAYEEDGAMWVPANDLFHALGWQMTTDLSDCSVRLLTGRPVAWEAEIQAPGHDYTSPIHLTRRNGVLMGEVGVLQQEISDVAGRMMTPQCSAPVLDYQLLHGAHDFRFSWDRTRAWSDGRFLELPAAPYISAAGTGMAPVQAVCEALGLTCTYDEAKKLLTVRQKPVNP